MIILSGPHQPKDIKENIFKDVQQGRWWHWNRTIITKADNSDLYILKINFINRVINVVKMCLFRNNSIIVGNIQLYPIRNKQEIKAIQGAQQKRPEELPPHLR